MKVRQASRPKHSAGGRLDAPRPALSEPAGWTFLGQSPQILAWAGLLLLLALVAYGPAINCAYIWDDDFYVTANQSVQAPAGLLRIWFDWKASPQYYPMVFATFWLEYHLWGLNPIGYHLVNILLHGTSAVLLWRILLRLRVPGAWLAAAIFAVHPMHAESVAWVTERKNVLSCAFGLASLLAWLRWADLDAPQPQPRRRLLYVAALAFFTAAMLSKTVVCVLPPAIIVLIWWRSPRWDWRRVLAVLPMFAVGIPLGLVTAWVERNHVGAEGADWAFTLLDRCLIAGRVATFYAGKILWPVHLCFIYPRWQINAHVAWQYLFPLGVLGVLIILWLLRRRIGKGPLAAALIFVGALFPASGFINVYPMRFSFVADHFAYLASIPFIALLAAALYHIANHARQRGLPVVVPAVLAGCLLAALAGRAAYACVRFFDAKSLWTDTLRSNPDAWLAHDNLGVLLKDEGKYDEAAAQLRESVRLKPGRAKPVCNLALIYNLQNRLDEGLAVIREGLTYTPDDADMLLTLAMILSKRGETAEAEQSYRRSIQLRAGNRLAHYHYAMLLLDTGRGREAAIQFRSALQSGPWPLAGRTLAWILATHPDEKVRSGSKAVRLAEEACDEKGVDPLCFDVLAAALAETGRYDQAGQVLQGILPSLPPAARPAIEARYNLYLRGLPFRDAALGQ